MSDYMEAYCHALGEVCSKPGEPLQSVEDRVNQRARMLMDEWHIKGEGSVNEGKV